MKRIKARRLLDFKASELWDILTGPMMLILDNGEEVETNAHEVIYSTFAWEYHRRYPKLELKKSHLVTTVLKGKLLNPDTHLELIGNVCWDTYDAYVDNWQAHLPSGAIPEVKFRDQLAMLAYEVTNEIYNHTSYRCEEWVSTLDLTHYMSLLAHPRVRAINNAMVVEGHTRTEHQQMIDENYRVIGDVIENDPVERHNPLCVAVRNKTIKKDQLLQAVGVRGFLTDISSFIFEKHPIMTGFVRGLRSSADLFLESRSAAKSLAFTDKPLQDAEYFSRRLQLVSQSVKTIHFEDCGSTKYDLVKIRGDTFDEDGKLVRANDLALFRGKFYRDDDGLLKSIKITDKHLIGKSVKMRMVRHCYHPDPTGICAVCFGELYLSVPENTNIGHYCCTNMAQKTTQLVMSVKHHDSSSVVDGVTLDEYQRQYLKASADGMSYLLSEKLKGKRIKLRVSPAEAPGLMDIVEVDDIHVLQLSRVTELKQLSMYVVTPAAPGRPETSHSPTGLDVCVARREASMTYNLLNYIKARVQKYGWELDEVTGSYIIDMAEWDWNQPILTLPLRHYNMSDHANAIAALLESTVDEMEKRDNVDPSAVLMELFDLVNSKPLAVNLAICEVVIYGAMIISAENNDYRLPKPWTPAGLGVLRKTMFYRSTAPAVAFESHRQMLTDPASYNVKIRPDHPMDGVLMPFEVFGKPGDHPEWKDYLDIKYEMMQK